MTTQRHDYALPGAEPGGCKGTGQHARHDSEGCSACNQYARTCTWCDGEGVDNETRVCEACDGRGNDQAIW